MMRESISVVIPVYNGANSLPELYQLLSKTLQEMTDDFEIIMVDDFSSDKSYEGIISLHEKDKRVKGIRLAENFGQQNALLCGFNYVKGDYIVTLDDDLQHRPEDIILLYNKIKKGYDIVYGIPEKREYSFMRKMGSRLTNFLFGIITAKKPKIRVSSFRILRRELLEQVLEHDPEIAFVYISAIVFKYTDRIGNIIVQHNNRKYGRSNYNFRKLLLLFLKLYIYYGGSPILKGFRSKKPQYIIEKKIGI